MGADRDRVTVRRALRSAAVAGGGGGAALVVAARVWAPAAVPGAVAAGIAVGALVASGWLLLAALLDVAAGEPPDRRRWAWTAAATLLALLGPFLVLATLAGSG